MIDRRCGTLDHVYLSHLADRGRSGLRVGWAEVFRDAWFGILVWLGACAVVFFAAGPVWAAVPLGLWLSCVLIVTMTRLLVRHTLRCSLMYGVHWPLQLGELI
ncbi:hypothetical protein [Streptomyces sp. XY006]|uniref:hypothetical protein n=1 Tax=Streptomyces sp. XY006 TaxID=2021410 RepID=UPI00117E0B11|nr:hypothetical protein [Streptomyces sp. XY006]